MTAIPKETPKLWLKMVRDRYNQLTAAGGLKTLTSSIYYDTAVRGRSLPCLLFFIVDDAPERIFSSKTEHEVRFQFSIFDESRSVEGCMDVVKALHDGFRDSSLLVVGSPYTLVDFLFDSQTGPTLDDDRVWQHTSDYVAWISNG